MREIEVKYKLVDKESAIQQLTEKGVTFSDPITQTDHVFVNKGTPLPGVPMGSPVYRVRVQDRDSVITLKIPQSKHQDCYEKETIVHDPDIMLEFFHAMDLDQMPTVSKTRIKGTLGQIEICIDEVDQLGTFIEAEKMITDDTDADHVQEELREFLENIGVSRDDEVINGKYDIMLFNKLGLGK